MEKAPQLKDSKPIYILIASDPTVPSKFQYYYCVKALESGFYLDVVGWTIKKAQIKIIKSNPREFVPIPENEEINRQIPWSRIVRKDNITYKFNNSAKE